MRVRRDPVTPIEHSQMTVIESSISGPACIGTMRPSRHSVSPGSRPRPARPLDDSIEKAAPNPMGGISFIRREPGKVPGMQLFWLTTRIEGMNQRPHLDVLDTCTMQKAFVGRSPGTGNAIWAD